MSTKLYLSAKGGKSMEKIIEVKNLTKDYGYGRGVFDVSFYVSRGEVYGFLGPNGAGKSTTIRHLMGFSKPDKGNTFIKGFESFSHYSEILKDVGYIPGEIAFPAGLTGYGLLKMELEMKGASTSNRLDELLSYFELDDASLKVDTKHMSLGVKRKLAIVIAFMNDPSILIFDEPTSGLDPKMQEKFIELVIKEKEKGKTILLSSHIFSEVDATCDRIGIIKDGKIVSEFRANDLKHARNKLYEVSVTEFDKFVTEIKKSKDINILSKKEDEQKLTLSIDESKTNILIALLAKYHVLDFVSRNESLEDYFMKFYHIDKTFKGID